ncbi:hypothetical protein V1525DRAFT_393563 [Lipomyces kononenkoae]|uniref:Uncharacterized protein n=1 Tax=Lipomyces kononenkoae TaxID=34357 RepID=A0ACC3TAT6_LIPKO
MIRLGRIMFRSSSSLYAHIPCPVLPRCRLPHCLFSHGVQQQIQLPDEVSLTKQQIANHATVASNNTVNTGKESDPKRLSTAQAVAGKQNSLAFKETVKRGLPAADKSTVPLHPVKRVRQEASPSKPTKSAIVPPSSPVPEDRVKDASVVYILPVKPHPPAMHSQRLQLATALAKALRDQGLSSTPNNAASAKEHEIASRTTSITYVSTMKHHIISLGRKGKSSEKAHETKDIPNERILEYLPRLVHTERQLGENKYMTALPSQKDIDEAIAAAASGYETCDRCTRYFRVGADGQSECLHHWGKPYRVKGSDKKFSCCGEIEGMTAGCRTSPNHVFRITHYPRLAAMIPFRTAVSGDKFPAAVALDCEMGYTTLGTELIRLTILEFPSSKVLYDTLVKPIGDVIDLNTQYSGVASVDEPGIPSFDAAMTRVFDNYIGADTILIGHGLENDLAVMRLFHQKVIDTSILFPLDSPELVSRGYKRSLKSLASSLLQRDIQVSSRVPAIRSTVVAAVGVVSSGSTAPSSVIEPEVRDLKQEGHDSIEDAKAAADLVALRARFMLALEDQRRAQATSTGVGGE